MHPVSIHASLAEPDAAPVRVGAPALHVHEVIVNFANIGIAPVALPQSFSREPHQKAHDGKAGYHALAFVGGRLDATSGFQCAGCGEWNETVVDASAGMKQTYVRIARSAAIPICFG